MNKTLLNKAIISTTEQKPADFNKTLESLTTEKLKAKIDSIVTQKEKEVFKKV